MAAIGFLLIMIGIGSIIIGFHGGTLWSTINKYFASTGNSTTTATA